MEQRVAESRIRWPMPDGGDSLVLPIAPECWAPPHAGLEIDGVAFEPKPDSISP
ncbi:MAG: hypothetical protein ACREPV_00020 [Lysobacter sp.]